jgi:hypothetical protein
LFSLPPSYNPATGPCRLLYLDVTSRDIYSPDISIYLLIIAQQLMSLLIIQIKLKDHSRPQMLAIHWPETDGLLRQSGYPVIVELKVMKKQISLLKVIPSIIKYPVAKSILPMCG